MPINVLLTTPYRGVMQILPRIIVLLGGVMQIDLENLHYQTLFFYTVDGERLYQYSPTLSRSKER
jgi:hypothetical protein